MSWRGERARAPSTAEGGRRDGAARLGELPAPNPETCGRGGGLGQEGRMDSRPGQVMPGMGKGGGGSWGGRKKGREGAESRIAVMKKVSMCVGRAAQSDAGIFLLM